MVHEIEVKPILYNPHKTTDFWVACLTEIINNETVRLSRINLIFSRSTGKIMQRFTLMFASTKQM